MIVLAYLRPRRRRIKIVHALGVMVVILVLSCLAGFQSAKAQTCVNFYGNSTNYDCQNGVSCGTTGYSCTVEYCSWNGGCQWISQTFNQECVWGGCVNPFQGNCHCTPI
jgi:ABC-type lipoprotein release transport system permease subunit